MENNKTPAKSEEKQRNKPKCTLCGREFACHNQKEEPMVLTEMITKEWLTSKEAAKYLGLTERSLFNLTSNGKVPYYKFGRRNRYLLEELKALLLSNRRGAVYGN